MKAKDTVMRASELGIIIGEVLVRKGISTTADTDFDLANVCLDYISPKIEPEIEKARKAGRKAMLKDIEDGKEDIGDIIDSLCQEAIMAALKNGKQAGIKEVVDWIKENHKEIVNGWEGKNELVGLDIDPDKWRAKLEEWGIK